MDKIDFQSDIKASMAVWVEGLGLRYPAPMVGLWATGWGLFGQVNSQAVDSRLGFRNTIRMSPKLEIVVII